MIDRAQLARLLPIIDYSEVLAFMAAGATRVAARRSVVDQLETIGVNSPADLTS